MIRLLYAMGGPMVRAGAETMVMRYIRELIKSNEYKISILIHANSDENGDYDEELQMLGIPIFRVPRRGTDPIKYQKNLDVFFRENEFDIVHCHMDVACGVFLSAAKRANIPVRIAHSHLTTYQATNPIKKIAGFFSKKKIPSVATHRLACSKKAGDWLFEGRSFEVINNALDLDEYRNVKSDCELRKKLMIDEDDFVIGHIGRFCLQKNHEFLLEICSKISRPKWKLVLVGVGPLLDNMIERAEKLGIKDRVLFLGLSNDIPKIMNMFDVFVMPSLFEGLPVTGIEAQASGKPCIFSDRITPEICFTSNAKMYSLENKEAWINSLSKETFINNIDEAQKALSNNGYSIKIEAQKLNKLYKDMLGD